jgi:predicted component of type VI protein secretion system
MDTQDRKNLTSLIQDLEKNAPEYNVFYAIHIAEKISKIIHPDRDDSIFDQKGLRFRPYENYIFPPKDIRAFEYSDEIMTFVLNFMGLYGINSPLPRCYVFTGCTTRPGRNTATISDWPMIPATRWVSGFFHLSEVLNPSRRTNPSPNSRYCPFQTFSVIVCGIKWGCISS